MFRTILALFVLISCIAGGGSAIADATVKSTIDIQVPVLSMTLKASINRCLTDSKSRMSISFGDSAALMALAHIPGFNITIITDVDEGNLLILNGIDRSYSRMPMNGKADAQKDSTVPPPVIPDSGMPKIDFSIDTLDQTRDILGHKCTGFEAQVGASDLPPTFPGNIRVVGRIWMAADAPGAEENRRLQKRWHEQFNMMADPSAKSILTAIGLDSTLLEEFMSISKSGIDLESSFQLFITPQSSGIDPITGMAVTAEPKEILLLEVTMAAVELTPGTIDPEMFTVPEGYRLSEPAPRDSVQAR